MAIRDWYQQQKKKLSNGKKQLKQRPYFSTQSGQVGVVILLIMVVLLTVGLSVASRTTQDLFLSQQQVNSARVFNAAEAGVDEAFSTSFEFEGDVSSGTISNFNNDEIDVDYQITKLYQIETRLFEMYSVVADVAGNPGLSLQIDWSRDDDCAAADIASLIASIYYDDAGTTRVRHVPIQGCDRGDNFDPATAINADGYRRRYILPLTTDDQFVRIKPLYADTFIRVRGDGWTMPEQQYNVRSEATNTNGTETRIINVSRTLDGAPSIFDYAVFSGSNLVK